MDEHEVTISLSEYLSLQEDSDFLNCLRMTGVDNWEGYSEAQKRYREEYPQDEEE